MLTPLLKKTTEKTLSGKELFGRVEKAYQEHKIDSETRLDIYCYWLIFHRHRGKWDKRFEDRPELHPFYVPGPRTNLTIDDVKDVFEVEE